MTARRAATASLFLLLAVGAAAVPDARLAGYVPVAENASLVLTANLADCGIALLDKSDGAIWFSNPPDRERDELAVGVRKMQLSSRLIVTYASADNQTFLTNDFVSSVRPGNFSVTMLGNGIRFDFDFGRSAERFRIPLEVTLADDHLKARIVASEIEEYGESRVLTVTLLPFFGAGGTGDEGYLLVPDGCGALIRFNNGRQDAAPYQEYVYGRDPVLSTVFDRTVRQRIHLPVFGLKRGPHAFLAVITGGEFLARIDASVSGSGSGYNSVASTFKYRESDNVVLAEADWSAKDVMLTAEDHNAADRFEVRYYPLSRGEADWPGMAARYRRYLLEECGVRVSDAAAGLPLYLELYGAIRKEQSVLGLLLTVRQPLTTFAEAEGILERLRDSGVAHIVASYRGWMRGGEHGRVPARVVPERKLGGWGGLQDLLRFSRAAGIELYLDADLLPVYRNGNGYLRSLVAARTVARAPATQFEYRLSTHAKNSDRPAWNLLSPLRIAEAAFRLTASFGRVQALGASVGSLGSLVYSDYRLNRIVDRQSASAAWIGALEAITSGSGPAFVRDANAYALPYARRIGEAPLYSSRFDIEDEEIPFYPMVLHGIVPYGGPALNLASDVRSAILRTVEYGAGPAFSWVAAGSTDLKETDFDHLYAAPVDPWLKEASALARRLSAELGGTTRALMVAHERLAPGLFLTSYSDGTRVVVNYNRDARTVDGKTVDGRDWVVTPGGSR